MNADTDRNFIRNSSKDRRDLWPRDWEIARGPRLGFRVMYFCTRRRFDIAENSFEYRRREGGNEYPRFITFFFFFGILFC